jgi:hypothetical protein
VAIPLTLPDVFVGVVEANTGVSLTFPSTTGDIGVLLDPESAYYVEVQTGDWQGERLDVDAQATVDAGGPTVVLALGRRSHSTLPSLADGALAGARCALRPHVTLALLQAMVRPDLAGHDRRRRAEGVYLFEREEFRFYQLEDDDATWTRAGSRRDRRNDVIPPDTSLLLEVRGPGRRFVQAGAVRGNDFRTNLSEGKQAFATGFPVALSPAEAQAFVSPHTPAPYRWKGSRSSGHADEIRLVKNTHDDVRLFLDADGESWRVHHHGPDLSQVKLLRALGMVVVERHNPDPAYRIPPPFVF